MPPISAAAMLSRKLDSTNTSDQQHDAALPVVRQQRRHLIRNPALLEMAGQQRKSHQQQEQIGQRDPLMRHVVAEAAEAGAVFEAGEDEFVDDDHGKPGSATGSVL